MPWLDGQESPGALNDGSRSQVDPGTARSDHRRRVMAYMIFDLIDLLFDD